MFRITNIVCIFAICLVTLSCGKKNPADSGDVPAGSLSERSGHSNQAVTEQNHENAALSVYVNTLQSFNALLQRAYDKKGSDGKIVLKNEEISGLEFGKAIGSGTMTAHMSGGTLQSFDFNFDCIYHDYASFSGMWLGGKVNYTGAFNSLSGEVNMTTNGEVRFNGVYAGSMRINATSFGTSGDRNTVIAVVTTSEGGTLTDTFSDGSGTTAKILGKWMR